MKEPVATGKIMLAIERMATRYPLHAGILARWQLEATAAFPTMAIGFDSARNRMRLLFSPEFVEGITLDELAGVLHHEVNHVLFEHVFHVPAQGEDRAAMTVAQEVTVNEWVSEPLPLTPILLADYPFLKPDEDTESRYRQLFGKVEDAFDAVHMPPPECQDGGGKGIPGDGQSEDTGVDGPEDGALSDGASGGGSNPESRSQSGGNDAGGDGGPEDGAQGSVPTDSHASWDEIRKNAAAAKAASDSDIACVWATLPAEKRGDVPQELVEIIEETTASAGIVPGNGLSDLTGGDASVSWQTVLRRYVGRAIAPRPAFGRPPRRYPNLVGIVPGKARKQQPPHVLAAIDTSGSLTNGMLADISKELAHLARRYQVTVVECDTKIHAVYPYRPIETVHGRGGTDLCPPLDRDFLRQQKADLVVYFTDGFGPAPEQAPRVPVIWCLTKSGVNSAGWGKEVRMRD